MPIKNIQTWKELSKNKRKKRRQAKSSGFDEQAKNEKEAPLVSGEKKSKSGKFNKKLPRSFQARWLILFIFLGAVFSWLAGWWIFSVSNTDADGGLKMTISGPETISSGEEVKFRLVIDNQEKDDLQDLEVTWHWPEGARLISSSLPAIEGSLNVWTLPDIPQGQTYEMEVALQVFGDAGETKPVSATLMYSLSNFSSVFYAEAEHSLTVGQPPLAVDFSGPEELEPLNEAAWQLQVSNLSGNDLFGTLEIELPDGLENVKTNYPHFSLGGGYLLLIIDKLSPDDKLNFSLEGLFAAGTQGEHQFIWRYKQASGEEVRILQEGDFKIYVIGDEIELKILVNKEEKISELNWGDEVEFVFLAKNITDKELIDGEWQITLPGDLFVWNSLSSNFSLVVERPGLVKLVAADNEVLKSFKSGEEKRIGFKLKLKDTPINDNRLDVQAKFSVAAEKNDSERISFSKSVGNITVKPLLKWHVSAHYYDDEGAPVGSGPLPPRVGQATTYRIYFNVSDFSSQVEKIIFSTILPSEIIWGGDYKVNYGIISFSPQTRQLQWIINNPSAYDLSQGELTADIAVRFVPNKTAVGSIIPLTGSVQMQAFTSGGTVKNFSAPMLTTSLEGDLYAQGKGIVQDN